MRFLGKFPIDVSVQVLVEISGGVKQKIPQDHSGY